MSLHRPDRNPCQRFRFEQYIEYLRQNGFQCEHQYLLNAKDDKLYYSAGHLASKVKIILKSWWLLFRISSKKKFDVVFVQREAFMLGTVFFERRFSKRAKLIYDFDDAIWMHQIGDSNSKNQRFYFLKNPNKTSKIIAMADLVIAGNEYLADYARNFADNIRIIPTTIDTEMYNPIYYPRSTESNPVCIGWSGSFSTVMYFQKLEPTLKRIHEKYGNRVRFSVIGDERYENAELGISGKPWKFATELEDLSQLDIGLMPLTDDEWAKGKCALKGLQYMSLEIPTIMSPVGVNKSVVDHGRNGFLADTEDEWFDCISLLVEDQELRKRMGEAGRKTVVEQYSVNSTKIKYLDAIKDVLSSK